MESFIGSIMAVSFGFAPKGWTLCNGALFPINQNQALFSLLGTNFGGNGTTTFGIPNLQGRVAVGMSGQFPLGAIGGEESHTLSVPEMPTHNHSWKASNAAPDNPQPSNAELGAASMYAAPTFNTNLSAAAISLVGGSQAHENRSPFLTLNYCICLNGIFPSRN